MSSAPAAASHTLSLFEPPYDELIPCTTDMVRGMTELRTWRGRALVWSLTGAPHQLREFEALRRRAPGIPLLVLLPGPNEVSAAAELLPLVRSLSPRAVVPDGLLETPFRIRHALALPPRNIPAAVTDYLIRRHVLRRPRAAREFQRIAELAPETRSITALSRRMYTSRRTLGRHFIAGEMPVPSHCLQFLRLLHVAIYLQNDEGAMFRVASRFGYPDGFTMSNQMKRLTGYRPSEVRELLGWEWVVEAWLQKEGVV